MEQGGGIQQITKIVDDMVVGLTNKSNVNEKLINLGQRAVINIETWRKNYEYSLLSN